MFQLPQEVKNGLENYKHSLADVKKGKIHLSRFKGIRVPWGIYSHRGGKAYMTRIRIPAGQVSAEQLKALATASQRYGNGILHLTTRQDIQIHNVKIEDTLKAMEYLMAVQLSPRGGGGNTVRNVLSCPLSGVCQEEVFDVRGYAISVTEYLLRQDSSFNLPRKFKIAFSACSRDCVGCLVNDLGFLAEYKGARKGFKVFAAGGMGASSRTGNLLEEFIPEEDLGYCCAAAKNVFYKKADRRNKHHNRLRFLVEDIGFAEFKKLYKNEFNDLKEKGHIVLRKIIFPERKKINNNNAQLKKVDNAKYNQFLQFNVSAQKQPGFSSIEIRIPRGEMSSKKLISLADLSRDFAEIEFHTTPNQNLLISWVSNQDVYNLFLKLQEIWEDFLYPQTLLDVVACKGALTCNLGLCNSPGLAAEIEKLVQQEFIGRRVFSSLTIKLNGCPNACGHQPIGKLSFYGMARRVDNRPLPFYKFFLGGRKELEKTKMAQEIGIIPAKNIPLFLREFLTKAEQTIQGKTDIYDFLEQEAKAIAKQLLDNYSSVPAYAQNRDFYIDWGKTEEFSLAGLGPGECGAGVLDMIESDLTQAKLLQDEAEQENFSAQKIKQVLYLSSRALLIVKGIDPKSAQEAISEFKKKFVDQQIASDNYANLKEVFDSLTGELNFLERKERFRYAQGLLAQINQIYKSMDSSFNFPSKKKEELKKAINLLDLKGTPCPLNYVKVKLVLENLDSGDILTVFLDQGEPIDSVPKSLESDGHKILKIEKQNGFFKVLVKKQ